MYLELKKIPALEFIQSEGLSFDLAPTIKVNIKEKGKAKVTSTDLTAQYIFKSHLPLEI